MRRMRILTKATDDIAKGNLNIRVDVEDNKRDEISQLGISFNKMAEALERQIEERKESEEQYRTLFETRRTRYLYPRRGKYLDINPALVDLYGYASKKEMFTLDISKDYLLIPKKEKCLRKYLKRKGS